MAGDRLGEKAVPLADHVEIGVAAGTGDGIDNIGIRPCPLFFNGGGHIANRAQRRGDVQIHHHFVCLSGAGLHLIQTVPNHGDFGYGIAAKLRAAVNELHRQTFLGGDDVTERLAVGVQDHVDLLIGALLPQADGRQRIVHQRYAQKVL